jgi:hypothetical protein
LSKIGQAPAKKKSPLLAARLVNIRLPLMPSSA